MHVQNAAPHRQIAQDTRALIRTLLSLVGAEVHVNVVHFMRDDIPNYLFQIQAKAPSLPILTGPEGQTWQRLRAVVLLIGAHHRLSFELGLADPPGSTWRAGVSASVLRVPVQVEPDPLPAPETRRPR